MSNVAFHPLRETGTRAQIDRCKREIAGHLQTAVDGLSETAALMHDVVAATGRPRLQHALDEIPATLADIRSITTSALPSFDFVGRIEDRLTAIEREIAADQASHEGRTLG
jgi:hypothetical protein